MLINQKSAVQIPAQIFLHFLNENWLVLNPPETTGPSTPKKVTDINRKITHYIVVVSE